MAEHVFFPDKPPKPLQIKYDGLLYDGGNWDQFPIRYGWKLETGAEKFPRRAIPKKFHSGIASWLYFGMLHYVFGDKLDQSDFLLCREEGPQQYITTKHLHKYIDDAKEWKKKKLGERAVDIVKKVCEQLSVYGNYYVQDDMSLAIRLVCYVLWDIAVKRDGPQTQTSHVRLWMFTGENETKRMVAEGWCPLDAAKCRVAGGGVDTPAYLLQLMRVKAEWNTITHESCTNTECVANNVDESDYVTRHVQEDCTCSHLQSNVEQLHTILRDGGVPLLMITPSGEDKLGDQTFKIEIVRKRVGKQYLAISHVWSDGLGNTQGNSLPHCQLKLLYEEARRVLTGGEYVPRYEGGPFGPLHTGAARLAHFAGSQALRRDDSVLLWIDTLCIPHQPDVRSLAIQRIREVYVDAYRTMILDSEMRHVSTSSTTHLELLLRVLHCSGWMRRLWTLQEGLAAKSRLYVLFSDKAVNIATIADELLTKLDRGKLPIMQERIANFAMGVWFTFFKHTIDSTSKFERFVSLVASPFEKSDITKDQLIRWNWFNVATRATSKAADRPIILAGILNLDVKVILEVKGSDERMRKFYSLIDNFPQGVLFQPGPRFEEEGMRWAMKVCQYTKEIQYLSGGPGKITPRGLQITLYPSWLFSSQKYQIVIPQERLTLRG
ncbi:Heterokaryon incompatibility [Penicillium expansum]|uniref:Heterokaryon incompatibility n=1 Tax=Penicillium expansum TaxID=27334 RepID=A0A0A2ILJ4_PENEN|nr:Heterokaryon incompatibility [Penicillium expansum]KGO43967.1 Heterokaryon incompatibility [Penicillium expansum]KGO52163.1 Heterokaryon incompatibility [Penicillium expansum]